VTIETKHFVALMDLVAIEITCPAKDCHSKMTHSIPNFRRLPLQCSNCNATILKEKDEDYLAIEHAVNAIRALMLRRVSVELRFEVVNIINGENKERKLNASASDRASGGNG
jgi:hypothetical protein